MALKYYNPLTGGTQSFPDIDPFVAQPNKSLMGIKSLLGVSGKIGQNTPKDSKSINTAQGVLTYNPQNWADIYQLQQAGGLGNDLNTWGDTVGEANYGRLGEFFGEIGRTVSLSPLKTKSNKVQSLAPSDPEIPSTPPPPDLSYSLNMSDSRRRRGVFFSTYMSNLGSTL